MFQRLGGGWVSDGLDALIPPRCVICQDDLPPDGDAWNARGGNGADRVLMCSSCRRDVTTDAPRCQVCGERLGAVLPCEGCRRIRHGCAGLAVLGGYRDDLRTAILRCKRPGAEPLIAALAGLLVARHRETFAAWGIGLIVPVPMHWSRRMVRGASAADELAAAIAGRLGLPRRLALRRSVATRMQNELPIEKRRGNVAEAFQPRGDVHSKTILLIDDVCTTGSTLAACSRRLAAAGARGVYAAVVAKADRSPDGGDD